jgi:hypothetical protein
MNLLNNSGVRCKVEGTLCLIKGQHAPGHAVHDVDSERDEFISQQGKGFERGPVVKRLRRAREHFAEPRLGASGKNHLNPVLANIECCAQGVCEIAVVRPRHYLRFVDYQQERLLLPVQPLEDLTKSHCTVGVPLDKLGLE